VNKQTETVLERRLIDGLNILAESKAPATRVTVAEVIASGRIQGRRRRPHRIFALSA
jgi:hypothetical protein